MIPVSRLLFRGSTKACPVCGDRRLFKKWFTMIERCPTCNLQFERIEGHWSGSLGLNTIVSFGTLLLVLVIGLIVTFPEFPIGLLIAVNVGTAVVVPLLFFPISRTLWTAIDIAMRPLEQDEVDWESFE